MEYPWSAQENGQAVIVPVWVRRLSHLRLSVVTTFQTWVPRVSLGRTGGMSSPLWLRESTRCQQASHPRLCHNRTHAAHPSHRYSCAALTSNTS